MPDRIAFKQMGEFGEAADYACQRDRQEQDKKEYFEQRGLGRDGLCRQFPESLFRFIARAQSNRFWFPIRKKTLFLGWLKQQFGGRDELDDGGHGSCSGLIYCLCCLAG